MMKSIDEIEQIKKDEGFVPNPYKDSRGFLTIGYGTKLPLSPKEAELLLYHRLKNMVQKLYLRKPIMDKLPQEAINILTNMVYNLGVEGLLGFKKMWKALENFDYITASKEMENSLWFHQVGIRAKRLVKRMKDLANG